MPLIFFNNYNHCRHHAYLQAPCMHASQNHFPPSCAHGTQTLIILGNTIQFLSNGHSCSTGGCKGDLGPVFLKSAFGHLSIRGEAQLAGHCSPQRAALPVGCSSVTHFSCSLPKQFPQKRHSEFIFSTMRPRGGEKK